MFVQARTAPPPGVNPVGVKSLALNLHRLKTRVEKRLCDCLMVDTLVDGLEEELLKCVQRGIWVEVE